MLEAGMVSPPPATGLRYRALPADALVATPLDGLTLIFHRQSGLTHFVADPVPDLLAALWQGPADAALLTDRLAARFDLASSDGGDPAEIVAAHLAELDALGLVRRDG